jgi:hypothetical protein
MTPSRGVLLCQRLTEDGRLLARTLDAGRNWERWVDGRAVSGLDGRGPIIDLDAVGARGGMMWTVFARGVCPEGQIRRSTGRVFDPLPCPSSDSVPVDTVLGVAFWSATQGYLLGLDGASPVLAVTSDGGATWSPVP